MQILDGEPICFTQKDIALIKKTTPRLVFFRVPPPPSHGEGLLSVAGLVGQLYQLSSCFKGAEGEF